MLVGFQGLRMPWSLMIVLYGVLASRSGKANGVGFNVSLYLGTISGAYISFNVWRFVINYLPRQRLNRYARKFQNFGS